MNKFIYNTFMPIATVVAASLVIFLAGAFVLDYVGILELQDSTINVQAKSCKDQ